MEVKEAPNSQEQATHPLTPAPDLDTTRLLARRGLLTTLEAQDRRMQQGRGTDGLGSYYEQAFRMLSSSVAKNAFNLNLEPDRMRERVQRIRPERARK